MRYMVLNDGETYTDLQGCRIVQVDEAAAEGLDHDLVIAEQKYVLLYEFDGTEPKEA